MDSQELWIASVIGDAHFAGLHGTCAVYVFHGCVHVVMPSCCCFFEQENFTHITPQLLKR